MNTIQSAGFHYPNCQTWTGGQCNCDEIQDRACKEIQASRASKREEQPHGAMTPGPWQVLDRRHYDGTREDGNLTPWIIYGDGEPIARVVQEFVDGEHPATHNEQRAEANARAIAALPDVLNALELAQATIERLHRHAPGSANGTLDVIRSALQKAGCL